MSGEHKEEKEQKESYPPSSPPPPTPSPPHPDRSNSNSRQRGSRAHSSSSSSSSLSSSSSSSTSGITFSSWSSFEDKIMAELADITSTFVQARENLKQCEHYATKLGMGDAMFDRYEGCEAAFRAIAHSLDELIDQCQSVSLEPPAMLTETIYAVRQVKALCIYSFTRHCPRLQEEISIEEQKARYVEAQQLFSLVEEYAVEIDNRQLVQSSIRNQVVISEAISQIDAPDFSPSSSTSASDGPPSPLGDSNKVFLVQSSQLEKLFPGGRFSVTEVDAPSPPPPPSPPRRSFSTSEDGTNGPPIIIRPANRSFSSSSSSSPPPSPPRDEASGRLSVEDLVRAIEGRGRRIKPKMNGNSVSSNLNGDSSSAEEGLRKLLDASNGMMSDDVRKEFSKEYCKCQKCCSRRSFHSNCQILYRKNAPVQSKRAFKLVAKLLRNAYSNPTEQKYRSIKLENRTFRERINAVIGGCELMDAVGFTKAIKKTDGGDEEHIYYLKDEDLKFDTEHKLSVFAMINDLMCTAPQWKEKDSEWFEATISLVE